MTWVFRVGNQTLRITASNAAEALRRAKIVFPGQTISGVREGGQSGDANFRLINPSYIDAQNNPVYTAESTTGDLTGARAPEFTRDTFTTADPARDTGGMGGNGGGNGSGGYVAPTVADPLLSTDPSYSDESQPFAAFTRGLRQAGLPTAGFLGDRFRSQYDPLRSLSTASLAAGTSPLGPRAGDWEQFAEQFGGNRQASRQLAADTLRSLFRRGGGEAGIVDDPRTAAAQAFANPDVGVSFGRLVGAGDNETVRASQLANANDMLQLFQQALGNQTSGLLASRLAPKFQQNLLRDFEERVTPEQGQVSFGDFFRTRAQDFLGPNFGQPSLI